MPQGKVSNTCPSCIQEPLPVAMTEAHGHGGHNTGSWNDYDVCMP
jgi:hypothetical protein